MNEKILVVDDEKEIADLLEVYLKNDNYTVYKYYSGIEALKCIEETEIDLAILDIMLPDIDGFRICQIIREKFYFPDYKSLWYPFCLYSAITEYPPDSIRSLIGVTKAYQSVFLQASTIIFDLG